MSIIGCYTQNHFAVIKISCSKGNRGFGSAQESAKKQQKNNNAKIPSLQSRKSSDIRPSQAPGLNNQTVDKKFSSIAADVEFEERLQAIRRSALEQKKVEETTQYGPIDYDAPVVSENKQVGIATKMKFEVSGVKAESIFDDVFSKMVAAAQPIPGFRRVKGGKTPNIPKDVLIQVLGPSKVYKQVITKVINSTVAEYVEREKLNVTKDLKVEQSYEELEAAFEPGEEFSFDVTIQLRNEDV